METNIASQQGRMLFWQCCLGYILVYMCITIFSFHQLSPLGRVGLVVAMCVCLFVSLMCPFHVIFLRGRPGAERALSVDWCDLDLDLNLDLE